MEDVLGKDYLGIKIFRFYYRCTACSAEFCMKTAPKNADYVVEGGATRNYEPWRDKDEQARAYALAPPRALQRSRRARPSQCARRLALPLASPRLASWRRASCG